MHPHISPLLILVAAAATSFLPATQAGACLPHKRDALLAFKHGIISDPAGLLDSWQGAHDDQHDCCRWRGVRCSDRTSHVEKLRVRSDFNDPSSVPIVGQISHSLLSLVHLDHLDLSGNSLQGSDGRIPQFLGSLKSLKYLDLSGIPFSGQVPSHLGNLSNLQYLDLSSSSMGDTHTSDMSWLTRLQSLRYLNLGGVNLGAAGDWPHALNMISSLRALELSGCSLTSANQSLPNLNLTGLEKLDLSSNYIDNPIASCWFWNITHLKHLDLSSTNLYGPLPHALQDMTYLQGLDISQVYDDSKAKCIMTTSLRNLCDLEALHLGSKLLHGDITELLESLPRCSSKKLRDLDLSRNNISGVLPNQMGSQLTSLEYLDLSSNNIRGVLPDWMGQLARLEFLGLSANNISGGVPNWVGQLTRLEFLGLARNNFCGVLPNQMGQLTSLGILDIASNNITGPLPSFLGNFTMLSYTDLSYNHLTGPLPYEIGMLSNLSFLNINNNDLNGTITEEHLGGLKSLQWIDLSSNSFKIEISPEWQPPFSLTEGHFASCQMGPLFPSWLKWMVDIDRLDISNTSINDHLPNWFCSTFSKLTYLSISNNQVHGALPANMESISLLQRLFLGSNQLTGQIPPMPTSLVTLDLSRNYFQDLCRKVLSSNLTSDCAFKVSMDGR